MEENSNKNLSACVWQYNFFSRKYAMKRNMVSIANSLPMAIYMA